MPFEADEAWVRGYCQRTGMPLPVGLAPDKTAKRRPKYGNQRVEVDGRTFDSKHEAKRWSELQLMLRAGEILGVFTQHPFRLPGDTVYIADFVVLQRDGSYRVEDAKSSATARDKAYRIKKRLMRECLGIEIVEV